MTCKRYSIYILCVWILFLGTPARSQVVINEVSTANASMVMDEEGSFPDWIELYNGGTSPVDLDGYGISDNTWGLDKWIMPSVIVAPDDYAVIFASGNDKRVFFDHWETAVSAEDTWRYIVPIVEPDSTWRMFPTYNDSLWQVGKGGIGYGDGDDSTIVSPPISSVYMRKVFNVTDPSLILGAVLHIDYDDGFVAYINGWEIARSNVGQNGKFTPFDSLAFDEHEASMYTGGLPELYFIPWAVFLSGDNVLTIQVHNVSNFSSDLTAKPYLSFAILDNSFDYGPVPSWFNIGIARMHTNFSLSQSGEILTLTEPSGTMIDQVQIKYMQIDDSYGRSVDGGNKWVLFNSPTPDSSNNLSTGYLGYTPDPQFSKTPGFYNGAQTISISNSLNTTEIRFTKNGDEATKSSIKYVSSIVVDSTRVIRARAFHDTLLPSELVTNTYFIDDPTSSSLPVISISTNPVRLWDYNTGIYVRGPNADSMVPYFGANFWQRREIPAYIEFFDKKRSQGFEQTIGVKIYGNWSRSLPQKSLKIIARENYGQSRINYQLFSNKDIFEFKQFILRNSGTDWNNIHFVDAVIHAVALKNTNVDGQARSPAAVYLNGKYWGVYNMREKINEHFIANNHGVDPDSIDLLEYGGLVMVGTNDNFYQMLDFIINNDLTDSANYEVIKGWLDIDNFIDYFSCEIYSANWDWLANNVRYWREQKAGAKWRYILWDLDNGWGSYNANLLQETLNKATWEVHAYIFANLLQNTEFRFYYINRFADLLNAVFTEEEFGGLVKQFRDTMDGEMPNHFGKWGFPFFKYEWGSPGHGSYVGWKNSSIPGLLDFIKMRPTVARQNVQGVFGLKQQMPVTLNVFPKGAGKILINTITIDSFPWAGIYFDSVPITITAIPNPGYEFSFWQSNIKFPSPDTNISITLNPDTNDVFTAYFFGAPDTPRVTISEINYHSFDGADGGDWIELHNYGNGRMDISGWMLKDGNDQNRYIIPENTFIEENGYLVLCGDLNKFQNKYPGVSNRIGSFSFGLSSFGEPLRLYDEHGVLYLTATYSSLAPWPQEPNGKGWTLELLDPEADMGHYSNWFAGCENGSPGQQFVPCDTVTQISERWPDDFDGVAAVYPNPVNDYFVVEINPKELQQAEFTFLLTEVTGREILRLNNLTNDEIVLRQLYPKGLYVYKVLSDNGYIKTGKLVFY